MKKTDKQRGITLIALVITIIILLILAGITITSLKETGLFTKAQQAKQNTLEAQLKENTILDEYTDKIAKYESVPITNVDTDNTNPEGAKPLGAVVIEGDADKGIVIRDTNENEWVWVEVPKTEVFSKLTINTDITLTDKNYTDIENKLKEYTKEYKKDLEGQELNWTDEWYAKDGDNLITKNTEGLNEAQKELNNGCGLTYNQYKELYQKMLKSIYKNGGFWISRYEAGIEGTNTDTTIDEIKLIRYLHSDINNDSPRAVSQVNRIPYNYVYCSEAQKLASAMSTDSTKTSSLIFGIQWDLVCKFIETKTELELKDIKADSTNWGNYKNNSIILTRGKYNIKPNSLDSTWKNITASTKEQNAEILTTTGASEDLKKMNIYDFAGNEWEWTLEKSSDTSKPCAVRGGSFNHKGIECPAAYRSLDETTNSHSNVGIRSTLY